MTHYEAHQLVVKALKLGTLVRPKICSECHQPSDYPIQAHHKDYDKPLDITWLCFPCHRKQDHRHARDYNKFDTEFEFSKRLR
jgi:hypothetical protein